MMTGINELGTLKKLVSCDCNCKFHGGKCYEKKGYYNALTKK